MTADNELTILLPLKDRAQFTYRWMSYANSIRFPFKVLIADGGADETVPKVLSNKTNFPNVNYEYRRYPYDQTYAEFYSKMADALSRIKTPFVVMADNDDFFIAEGLRANVEFLRAHLDYSSCSGQIGVFWVTPSDECSQSNRVYGKQIEYKWCSRTSPVIQETATQRIGSKISADRLTYYDVQRTEELKAKFETVRSLDLKNLYLVEFLLTFLAGIEGKIQRIDRLYLMRQWNSPDTTAGRHEEKFGDYWGQMLVESWSDDFTKFLNMVAAALVEKDRISMEDARNHVRKCYKTFVAPFIIQCLLAEPTVTTTMPIIARMVQRVVKLGPNSLTKRTLQKLYRRIPWISVNAVNGDEFFAYPSLMYRKDLKPIAKLLTQKPPVFDF